MKLAERHRLNPRKKKEKSKEKLPSSIRLRRKGGSDEPSVLYISKGVYVDSSSPSDESAEDFLKRINDKNSNDFSVTIISKSISQQHFLELLFC